MIKLVPGFVPLMVATPSMSIPIELLVTTQPTMFMAANPLGLVDARSPIPLPKARQFVRYMTAFAVLVEIAVNPIDPSEAVQFVSERLELEAA